MYRILFIVLTVIAALGASFLVGARYQENICIAQQSEKKDKAAEVQDNRDSAAASVHIGTQSYLWGALPPIELRTHDARERVRTIYRDNPIDCNPVRPIGVQAELDTARDRANAAAGQLRARADEIAPANPRTD